MNALRRTHGVISERERQAIYQECFKDIGTQCLAMCLYTLDKRYGWKKATPDRIYGSGQGYQQDA